MRDYERQMADIKANLVNFEIDVAKLTTDSNKKKEIA